MFGLQEHGRVDRILNDRGENVLRGHCILIRFNTLVNMGEQRGSIGALVSYRLRQVS
jgi:hypothetical protein